MVTVTHVIMDHYFMAVALAIIPLFHEIETIYPAYCHYFMKVKLSGKLSPLFHENETIWSAYPMLIALFHRSHYSLPEMITHPWISIIAAGF